MTDEVAQLNAALELAVAVIESYEMDIRNSEWTGVDLVECGFCQGTIYKNAVSRIKLAAFGAMAAQALEG